ncbi:MAG: hypothetical protein ACRDTF_24890 [Pseudonocardiaceae bacterium]
MAYLGSFAKESVKGLGQGAVLVSVLPSAILVLIVFALPAASLYPWQNQASENVGDGLPAILNAARGLGVSGAAVIVPAVLLVAVLVRPFQIAVVQVLEGYWTSSWLAFPEQLAIERHRRRSSMAVFVKKYGLSEDGEPENQNFDEVTRYLRQNAQNRRAEVRAQRLLDGYPHDQEYLLPTALGNILRRAELSAGERYGLGTVGMYPRLYPHLSARLDTQMSGQLNILDVSAALVFVFAGSAAASSPLIWRLDGWSLLPIAFVVGAAVAYRGARRAAGLYAVLLHTAFDLHRFDMLTALHRKLPITPEQELSDNQSLTEFLTGHSPTPPPAPMLQGSYHHPEPPAMIAMQPTGTAASQGGNDPQVTDEPKGDGKPE